MGYDVTFHPVSIAELERFVFDVARKPELAAARAGEVVQDAKKRAQIVDGIYIHFPNWLAEGGQSDSTFAFACAAIAGFRHPYWYARGSAISFLQQGPALFVPIAKVSAGLCDKGANRITNNYTASGVIPCAKLGALSKLLDAPTVSKVFDEDGLDALRRAIAYARAHELDLMEATDLVVPMADEAATDLDNLRAHFLKRLAPGDGPPKREKRPTRKPVAASNPKAVLRKADAALAALPKQHIRRDDYMVNAGRAAYLAGESKRAVLARFARVVEVRLAKSYTLDFAWPCEVLEVLAAVALAGRGAELIAGLRERRLVKEVPVTRGLVASLAAFFTPRLVAPSRQPKSWEYGPAVAIVAAAVARDAAASRKAIIKYVDRTWLPWSAPERFAAGGAPIGRISLFAGYAVQRAGLAAAEWPPEIAAVLPLGLL